MKRFASSLIICTCILTLGIVCPAFGALPALVGDIDGFGMGSGTGSLLYSLINTPVYSANISTDGAACGSHTYRPFSRSGATYILGEGDFLPDVNRACEANGDPTFIPFPLTTWPSTVRTVSFAVDGSPPSNYANYTRGSNPWLTTYGPNTDCWDNRSTAEINGGASGACFTDITLSPSFKGAWPHLASGYPLAQDTDPVVFTIPVIVTSPTPLYLYFPIGDYDAGTGATVTITALVGNDLTSHVFNLTKQDNAYQQGLVQGVTVELYNGGANSPTCGMPVYDNWNDFAVLLGSAYLSEFTVTLNMGGDPYYAIDYVVIDQSLDAYGVLMVGPNRTYTDIQDAIDAAVDGDTIMVDPGTYGPVDFGGKRITLTKWMGCDNPVIDGGGTTTAVTLAGTEALGTSIRGFDIRNGNGAYGGGISGNGANIHIEQCNFHANTGGFGGALYNVAGNVSDCTFTGNAALGGGAAYISGCSTRFDRCVFGGTGSSADGNSAWTGGVVFCQGVAGMVTAPSFSSCRFFWNRCTSIGMGGGAIYAIGASAQNAVTSSLTNCLFWNNQATGSNEQGGALYANSYSTFRVINCTFTLNTTVLAAGGGAAYISGGALYSYSSMFWGDTAAGVLSEVVLSNGSKTMRYSIEQGVANDSANRYYGTSGYNPNFISTAAATLNLRPQNTLAGNYGADPYLTPVVTKDIDGNVRPKPSGTKADWGAYEVFSQ